MLPQKYQNPVKSFIMGPVPRKDGESLRQPTFSYQLPPSSRTQNSQAAASSSRRNHNDGRELEQRERVSQRPRTHSTISQLPSIPPPPSTSSINPHPTSSRAQTVLRQPTRDHPLGDNSRTFIEGMIPKTLCNREIGNQASSSLTQNLPTDLYRDTPPASRRTATLAPPASRAPPHVKSILTIPTNTHMASLQTRLHTLSPPALQKQDIWARTQLLRSGVCPQGYAWDKCDDFGGGYLCQGKKHFVSNQLLADGQGGVFLWAGWPEPEEIYGPYYRDEVDRGWMVYGGVEPRDGYAPERFRAVGSAEVENIDVIGTAEQLRRMSIGGGSRSGAPGHVSRFPED